MKKSSLIALVLTGIFAVSPHVAAQKSVKEALEAVKHLPTAQELAQYTTDWKIPQAFEAVFKKMFSADQYAKVVAGQDASVKNTEKLANIPASQFLKNSTPCTLPQVAVGINTDGTLRCGSKTPMLVQARVRSGSLKVDTQRKVARDTIVIDKKIIAETKNNEQAELVFPDRSLLRMDQNTKITLSPVPSETHGKTIAQASYKNGLLWGRVLSNEGPQFENSGVIAGVRGTSIALQGDNITIYQSQQNTGGSIKPSGGGPRGLPKCSFFNTRTKQQGKLPLSQQINQYCLSGNNDTILNFTKKDLVYLNELIEQNKADEKILQEKNIIAPQEIQENSTFCPGTPGNNPQKTTFWPNVTNTQDMCQEKSVVAIAILTPEYGKIVYRVGNRVEEKKIDTKKKDGYYGGELILEGNSELQNVLNNSHLQTIGSNPFKGDAGVLMQLFKTPTSIYYRYSINPPTQPPSQYDYRRLIQTQDVKAIYFGGNNSTLISPVTLIFIKK
ncbi:MAG: hypothetical protein Q4A35_01645 [Candidatus Gracilibacteria bacterium]|nr:hypothetical protein [Candidatus Gracilibacteria bacterium]